MGTAARKVVYPDSDGKRMAENTLQYQWITTVQGNLDAAFVDYPDVFVAGDNLIYPVEGDPTARMAPDVYVAFGRPKGRRGCYRVWEEGDIFPQVVWEIRSPGNRAGEMAEKLGFYERYGAEEYYDYDPDRNRLIAYRREGDALVVIPVPIGFVSPRLGVRFEWDAAGLRLFRPGGGPFTTYLERDAEADENRRRAEANERRAESAEAALDALRAKLRAAGLDPDQFT